MHLKPSALTDCIVYFNTIVASRFIKKAETMPPLFNIFQCFAYFTFACAAAKRAIGTRKGEHDT